MAKALVEFMKGMEIDGTPVGLNPKYIMFIRPSTASGCTSIMFAHGIQLDIRIPFDEALAGLMGVEEVEEPAPVPWNRRKQ